MSKGWLRVAADAPRGRQRKRSANFAKWHTLGVQWSPGRIVYTIDGRAWATVKHKAVPTIPMVLAMQTQTFACGSKWQACPGASTPKRRHLGPPLPEPRRPS